MTIISSPTHPTWCGPCCCKSYLHEDGSVTYIHAEPSPTLRPAAQSDAELTVRRTLIDDRNEKPSTADVNVTLKIIDNAGSATYGGPPLTLDVTLDPMDARALAAQLLVVAEQVEASRQAGRRAA